MEEKREWKYCVAGNMRKIHFDDEWIIRYGTSAFTGGTKVFLCGKYWDFTRKEISVIGLCKSKRHEVHEVPVYLIENVRCQKVYRSGVLELMNNFEFRDCWWHNTKRDKREAEEFAEKWNALFNKSEA